MSAQRTVTPGPERGGCPSDARLGAWLEDQGTADPTGTLLAHLDACPACRQRLDRSVADPQLQIWLERHVVSSPETMPDPSESAVVRKLRRALSSTPLPSMPAGWHAEWSGPEPSAGSWPERIGPYRLERCLGQGSMGVVYQAIDARLGRWVAVKRLRADLDHRLSAQISSRLTREAAVLATLDHPHIVPVYEVGEHEGQPHLVLEFVAGGSLARWLRGRALPPAEAARALAMLARAVQHAHERGVVHRDLKPGNILLKPRSEAGPRTGSVPLAPTAAAIPSLDDCRLMIVDFGLARWAHDLTDLTRTGHPVGTPAYMAPEQAAARPGAVGPAADLYALGAVLYELLVGRPPFTADTVAGTLRLIQEVEPVAPRLLQPGVPRDLETITLKCLEKDPRRRYATAADLADDLERFLAHRAIVARPVRLPGRLVRWCRRNPVVAGLSALVLTLLVTLAVGATSSALEQSRLRIEADQQRQRAELEARKARDSEARTLTAYERADRGVRQALSAFGENAQLLGEFRPFTDRRVRHFRDQSLALADRWCQEYLDAAPDPNRWTATDRLVWQLQIQTWQDLGRIEDATRHVERTLAILDQRLAREPSDRDLYRDLYKGRLTLGNLMLAQGHRAQAIAAYRAALADLDARQRLGPDDSDAVQGRFALLGNLSQNLADAGQTAEAVEALHQSIALAARLLASTTDLPHYAILLADRHARAGLLETRLGRWQQAEQDQDEALDWLDHVPDGHPDAGFRHDHAPGYRYIRSEIRRQRGDQAGAAADLAEFQRLVAEIVARRQARVQLAETRLQLGEPESALVEAGLAAHGSGPMWSWDALEPLVRLAARLASDRRLASVGQDEAAALVLELLDRARVARISTPDLLCRLLDQDPDFAPLRDRAEFRALRQSLDETATP